MAYILGVDIGTSGTKTVLFKENGVPVASALYDYPLYTPCNGYAEQEPADWWNACVNGIRDVIDKSGVLAEDIRGIGLSGQMHGLVMLDGDNKVIRKSIIWCDQRTQKEVVEITEKVGAKKLIEITANPAITGFTAAKIMWVKNNEPENYEKCRHILLPKDYIRFMLTGEYATEVSNASGMQLPGTADETCVADIWKLVIGLDEVSVHDNFFEIGGTSLLLTQVHQMIQTKLKKNFPLSVLFQYPTIHALSVYLSGQEQTAAKNTGTPPSGNLPGRPQRRNRRTLRQSPR